VPSAFRHRIDGHDTRSGSGCPCDEQETDRSTTEHRDAAAGTDRVGAQGADGAGERLDEDGSLILQLRRNRHEARSRDRHLLGEDARAVHADEPPIRAQILLAGEAAGAAAAADERKQGVALLTGARDDLMSEHERRCPWPGVATVPVDV
jgi:hypothetical protein